MLAAIMAGLAMVYLVRMAKLNRLCQSDGDVRLRTWADMERGSVTVFMWTAAAACGVNLGGMLLSRQHLAPVTLSNGVSEAYLHPTTFIIALQVLIMVVGLIISAAQGSKAKKFLQAARLRDTAKVGTGAKIGMFALGWFGYWILVQVVGSVLQTRHGYSI
jgi:hypothetical protein